MIEPYQQGEFDALCGLYAIINAFRKVLEQDKQLPAAVWEELFVSLTEEVDNSVGLACAISGGLNTTQFLRILRRGVTVMETEYGYRLRYSRPFVGQGYRAATDVIGRLRSLSQCNGKSVLIGLKGTLNHWTVVRRIGSSYLTLFDSAGHIRVKIDRCRMSYEPSIPTITRHIIEPGRIVAVSNRV